MSSAAIATAVDNDNYAYSVRVTFGAGNTNILTLRGVRVSYTIARVEQGAGRGQATATTEAFEARLRRLEAAGEGQARR